jgi:hypothetical protein
MLGVKETVLRYCVRARVCDFENTRQVWAMESKKSCCHYLSLPFIGMPAQAHDFSLSLSLSLPPPSSGLLTRWWMARALSCFSSALLCVQSAPTREFETPKAGSSSWSPYNGNCVYTYIHMHIHIHIYAHTHLMHKYNARSPSL